MNTYTSAMKDHAPERTVHREQSKPWVISFAMRVILMCAFIFAAVTCRVMYSAKIEKLSTQAARLKIQIQEKELELTNLRNRKEALSAWPEIRGKMARYKLNLKPAAHYQITRIQLLQGVPGKGKFVRNLSKPAPYLSAYAQNKRR